MLPASELQDYQRIGTLTNMVRLMAGLGLFGSIATIIGTVVLFRRQRNFWSRVALFVALADGIDAMAKQGVRDPLVAGPASFGCQLQGMVIQAATLVSLLSAALVPLNLAACVFARSYAIRLQRSQQPILLALVTVSVILAIIPLATRSKHGLRGYGDADLWCWITYQNHELQMVLWLMPVWLTFGLHVLLYGMVGYHLSTRKRQSHVVPHPQVIKPHNYHRRFWRTALLSLGNVILFWLPSNAVRLYALSHDGIITHALALFLALLSPLRGFINFLLFLYIAITTKDRADDVVCGLGVWQCEQFHDFQDLESGGTMGAFTCLRQQLSNNPQLLTLKYGLASQTSRTRSPVASPAFPSRHSALPLSSDKLTPLTPAPPHTHLQCQPQCNIGGQPLAQYFSHPVTRSVPASTTSIATHESNQQSQLCLWQALSQWRNNQSIFIVPHSPRAPDQTYSPDPPQHNRSVHGLGQFFKAKLPSASMPNILSAGIGQASPRVPPSEVPLAFLKVDPYPLIPHEELMPQLQELLSYWPIAHSLHSGRSQVTSFSSLISSHWQVLLAHLASPSLSSPRSSQQSHQTMPADTQSYSQDQDWLWMDIGLGDQVPLCARFSFGPAPALTLQWPLSMSPGVGFSDNSHCDSDIAQIGLQQDLYSTQH